MTHPNLPQTLDNVSIVAALGSFTEILPPIAAAFTIIWTGIRIYEWARVRLLKKPKDGPLE